MKYFKNLLFQCDLCELLLDRAGTFNSTEERAACRFTLPFDGNSDQKRSFQIFEENDL
jgi:hypothetical protein